MILEAHNKAQTNRIIAYVGTDQIRFDQLVKLCPDDENLVTQQAGWPMSYIGIAHPLLSKKHLKQAIQTSGTQNCIVL